VAQNTDLLQLTLLLVQKVDLLHVHAELAHAVQRLAVSQPGIVLVDFLRFALEIVQDIHAQFQLAVDLAPVLHHAVVVGTQTHHDPHRQVLERTHGICEITVCSLPIGSDRSFIGRFPADETLTQVYLWNKIDMNELKNISLKFDKGVASLLTLCRLHVGVLRQLIGLLLAARRYERRL